MSFNLGIFSESKLMDVRDIRYSGLMKPITNMSAFRDVTERCICNSISFSLTTADI